jgi:ElaB/YqjD/DUF883 family membrane-anchored ribosome-binding protein
MSQVTTERLVEDLKQVVHDAEELMKATAGQAGENVARVRAKAETSLHSARARLAELGSGAVEGVREKAGQANTYVHANPWIAVGAGAVVGLLVGLLVGSRNNGKSS